jgi:hypothetical protein
MFEPCEGGASGVDNSHPGPWQGFEPVNIDGNAGLANKEISGCHLAQIPGGSVKLKVLAALFLRETPLRVVKNLARRRLDGEQSRHERQPIDRRSQP